MDLKLIIPDLRFAYTLDDTGVLTNSSTGKIIRPCISKRGYYVYCMYCENNRTRTFTRGRLMALAFLPNPLNLAQVDHIDGVKTNDVLENLRWCSMEDNIRWEHKTTGITIYPFEKILLFRKMRGEGAKWKQVADFAEYTKSVERFREMVKRRKI